MLRKIILAGFLFSFFFASSAAAQTVTDERVWFTTMFSESGKPGSPWRWTMEVITRTREGVSDIDTFGLRPTIIYALNSHSSIGGGYAYVPSFPASGGTTVEQRVYGQYVWTGPVAGGTVTTRTRVESRFIEGNSGALGRFRQQVRFSRPFKKGGKLSWAAYEELFVHVNDTTRSARGIDHNRLFGGLSLAASKAVRVEGGYLNYFSPGHRGAPDRRYHVLSGALTISF